MPSVLSVGPLALDPRRGMVVPGLSLGLVSDLHLGKARSFRAAGLAIPEGSDAATLARLAEFVRAHSMQTLVVVGDLVHNKDSLSAGLAELWRDWREGLQGQGLLAKIVLLPGNHDRHLLPQALAQTLAGIEIRHDFQAVFEGGLLQAAHEPNDFLPVDRLGVGTLPSEDESPTQEVVRVVGHTHPVAVLQGPGRDRLRLPCFVRQGQLWTLPAFGEFTGGFEVPAGEADARYAVGAGRVWPLPTQERP